MKFRVGDRVRTVITNKPYTVIEIPGRKDKDYGFIKVRPDCYGPSTDLTGFLHEALRLADPMVALARLKGEA